MGDETMVPLLEVVRRERAAFRSGVDAVACYITIGSARSGWPGTAALHASADARYPLPMVERPRVVVLGTQEYSVRPDDIGRQTIHVRQRGERDWRRIGPNGPCSTGAGAYVVDADRARVWADLFANPTETVPADA